MEAGSAQVLQLVSSGEFSKLLPVCEELELTIQEELAEAPTPDQASQLGFLYSVHMLACLLDDQLNAARFLWKRIPAVVQQHAQVALAHGVLAARWQCKFPEFFRQLTSGPWDASLQPLLAQVVARSREQLLGKIGNAYKAISADRVAALLGLDAASARQACGQRGWPVDAAGGIEPAPSKRSEGLVEMGEAQLQKLAEYVSYLERPQSCI
mmetsp:Transcript_18084/g.46961  ORF Transcript_18084/g.46961 Transcript_18084/m.46961 type:complete len:211 (+) Transcript_18084:86-718(+)|eukprot:CAMPEP_0183440676 /NCGR_PEP_ID=MMETSP0370-20130417/82427_1 /TAXON_ID=268820 /ORGANISM="Peridinium aciculiferum, Strain PAER-2" /LENGTH=210 /DNA_ID=CAMNT_0025629623 /DNA_START=76 /DNA_END=708 /DNA_ORIENTATION=-